MTTNAIILIWIIETLLKMIIALLVGRFLQLAVITYIKCNTVTYKDIKAHRKLEPWERQFNYREEGDKND